MDRIRLDDLVLQGCASHMDIIERILQEPVSRQFAKDLQLANKECEVSITIRNDEIAVAEDIGQQMHFIIACGSKSANWTMIVTSELAAVLLSPHEQLTNQQENIQLMDAPFSQGHIQPQQFLSTNSPQASNAAATIRQYRFALLEIFSRFKRFNHLNFCCTALMRLIIDLLLEIVSLNEYQPSFVKQLVFSPGGYYETLTPFEISIRDCNLIEALSPSLKELMFLAGEQPEEGTDLSQRFWKSISTCSSLKKLYLCRPHAGPDLFLNEDMRECLKSLKIREFHTYGNNERYPSVQWLFESLQNNAKIQKIYINPHYSGNMIGQLATYTALSVIARLRSVEIALSTHDYDETKKKAIENIHKIFRVLPKNSYVNVELLVCVHETTQDADDAEVVTALAYWLRLSNETQKPIKMYARINRHHGGKPVAITHRAVDLLKKQGEFANIRIEHRTDRTILQLNDAKIILCYKLLVWKPYLTSEYVRHGDRLFHVD